MLKDIRRKAFLYVAFIATGVALTIPGALLPLLLVRWSMNDARGGMLLFSFYAVGSFGSYCARGRMNWSVARGSGADAAGGTVPRLGGSVDGVRRHRLLWAWPLADDDLDQPAALATVSGTAAVRADAAEPGVGDWRGTGGRGLRCAPRGARPQPRRSQFSMRTTCCSVWRSSLPSLPCGRW